MAAHHARCILGPAQVPARTDDVAVPRTLEAVVQRDAHDL
jgi:hypothetical protein